jgi:hypothetical protein
MFNFKVDAANKSEKFFIYLLSLHFLVSNLPTEKEFILQALKLLSTFLNP